MRDYNAEIKSVKEKLCQVSSSFCIAKWSQVSIHLHNGTTHSCHHPRPHKIDRSLLADNPSALHNTPQKLSERAQMLKGERPKGCDYCWRVEDLPGDNTSDRVYKSSEVWAMPSFDKIKANPLDVRFNPTYIEVNLGSICNFKCSYCTPDVSTAWQAEVKQHGSYPTSGKHPVMDPDYATLPADGPNPYRDAFFQWWPEVYPTLSNFRITGGEPLLNKDLWKILEWIDQNPNPNLTLGINTNLCPPDDLWIKFLRLIKKISSEGKVKSVEIYTSAEAWQEKSEYIRHGMDFAMWKARCWQLLERVPAARLVIMATYNALSVTSMKELLEEILKIKRTEYLYNDWRSVAVFVDLTYLRYPQHQSIKILPREFLKFMEEQRDFMQTNMEVHGQEEFKRGFLPHECAKMERICNYFASSEDEYAEISLKETLQKDFYLFFSEHDRRRKTDFLQTFPEFTEFWNSCKALVEKKSEHEQVT